MWKTLTLTWIVVLVLCSEVCRSEDVVVVETASEKQQQQQNISNESNMLTISKQQILASQFECYLKILHDPPRTDDGPYCNRTWDGWLCWEDSAPGVVVKMCPNYFQDFDPEETVTKVCHPDGQWFHHPDSNKVWTNYTQCTAHTKDKLKFAFSLYYLALVGHSLSIVSLSICLTIFSYFKSLSCQRISLHKNMFLSFILNSIVTIIWLSVNVANNQAIQDSNPVSCKVLAALTQYMTTSNYFWMLCEGIYLHTLIIVAVFVGEQHLFWYYVLGWGLPIVPALTYAVARALYYNDNCWISTQSHLVYIIHGPIQVALLVNFFFLLNIVRVLITKLRETHCAETTTYMKAVRATLILIPLLGAQYILLPWMPHGRISQAIFDFFVNIFCHFQIRLNLNVSVASMCLLFTLNMTPSKNNDDVDPAGQKGLLVAIIFCFCNAEAQTAVRRKWAQLKSAWRDTPITNNHYSYHHNSSITETSRATINLEPAAASFSTQHKNSHAVPKEQQKSNGVVDMLNKLETTDI